MDAPAIVVALDAVRDDINLIWAAMGRGPDNLSRKLCAIDPSATWQTPPTHWMMQDMSAQQSDVDVWSAMAENNDLPPLPEGTVWGENGIIDASTAQAAISSGNMFVFPAYGLATDTDRDNWRDGVLAGMGLQFVPDEPI